MSKTKENDALRPQRRVSGSNINLSATQQSDEFFTDSILESEATRSSRIPNPILQKTIPTKRRSKRSIKVPGGKTQSSNKTSDVGNQVGSSAKRLQPAIDVRRTKSPSPLRNRIAATPPQTRIRTDLASPGIEIQSPPPEEFTDVYRQIADEEDLAATERESSGSDDSYPAHSEDEAAVASILSRHPATTHKTRSMLSHSSRSSTPTRHGRRLEVRDDVRHEPSSGSEYTGLSFLNELSDRNLAVKMTPHMSESAKDRARLREVWSNSKPVAFTKAGRLKPSPQRDTTGMPVTSSQTQLPGQTSRVLLYDAEGERFSRPTSRHSDGSIENYTSRRGSWDDTGKPLKDLPTNVRVERNFGFSRRHGFPQYRPALTEQNLEQQNRSSRNLVHGQAAPLSPLSHHSDPVLSNRRITSLQRDLNKEHLMRVQRIKDDIVDLVKSEGILSPNQQRDSNASMVDWAAAAADMPLALEENHPNPLPKNLAAESGHKSVSPEKLKKWDIDLTGQSFQVSESPPVRSKPRTSLSSLSKEIENLTKKAVTTNRLGELKERHSQEQLGHQRPVSSVRSLSASSEDKLKPIYNVPSEVDEGTGEAIPNTPIVIYRPSSSNSKDRTAKTQGSGSQGSSDEYLQRFARAMSNTPKSSPASTIVPNETSLRSDARNGNAKETSTDQIIGKDRRERFESSAVIAETPKVIGAWTDTILPDTVKTVKQTASQAKHVQTPHVSVGGWVDTPMVPGMKKTTEMTPIVEEIPEELIDGIARGRVIEHKEERPERNSHPDAPKVGLAGILDRAKQRLISQDITIAARENDTLNLGNETIESLQDLLTLDAEEFTMLSRVFNEDDEGPRTDEIQAEALILERIGAKLDRLRSNIHEARKGISKLEHKVSQPDTEPDHDAHTTTVICAACNKSLYTTSPYPHGGSLLVAPLHVTLPIPILFRFEPKTPESKGRTVFGCRIPQLTPFGYVTLAIWLWYITECTLSEIYSHPTYAEYYTWPSPHNLEPEFPYVLPTMLSRWFRLENVMSTFGLMLGWVGTMLHAATKILGMWAGWTDGFIDSDRVRKVVQGITSTAAASMGMETDMSMMNDEFI